MAPRAHIEKGSDGASRLVVDDAFDRAWRRVGLALDRVNGELWVANMGNYAVTVYPVAANGDAPPVRTIRGGPAGKVGLMIGNPGAIAYDSKREELLVPN